MSGVNNYALAHAIFDEKLYKMDPDFNLEKAFNAKANGINEGNNEIYLRFYNSVWYREDDYEPVEKNELSLPDDCWMIVGHTPQVEKVKLSEINGKPIFCVDNSGTPHEMCGLQLNPLETVSLGKKDEREICD